MSTATAEPVAVITPEDIDELRWLVRELLTVHVSCLDAGPSTDGAIADVQKVTTYAQALAALGLDCHVLTGYRSVYEVADEFPAVESLTTAVDELERLYRDAASVEPVLRSTTRRVRRAATILERLGAIQHEAA